MGSAVVVFVDEPVDQHSQLINRVGMVDIVYKVDTLRRCSGRRIRKRRSRRHLREAEVAGLTVTDSSGQGHSTHVISGNEPHPFRVWSTPKSADNHAKQTRRHIRRNARIDTP